MIEERIEALKRDLYTNDFSTEKILQKHIIDIEPFLFTQIDKNIEYEIRTLISEALDVHLNDIVIVGSSKLGYSISPKKLYKGFDEKYNETGINKYKSDIDVAVVSSSLFEELNKTLYNYTKGLEDNWIENEYYKPDRFNVPLNYNFYKYTYKGWFRPDLKPSGFEICKNGTFEELKRDIKEITGRKLGLGVYKSWYYFKNYHMNNLKKLKLRSQIELI